MKSRIAEQGFDYPAAPAQPCGVDDSSLSVAFDYEGPLLRAAVEQIAGTEPGQHPSIFIINPLGEPLMPVADRDAIFLNCDDSENAKRNATLVCSLELTNKCSVGPKERAEGGVSYDQFGMP